ncbi:Uncharacterised protein [uncultured archaeon]|nr:Uncharacterised protein [uncultured archaeon]
MNKLTTLLCSVALTATAFASPPESIIPKSDPYFYIPREVWEATGPVYVIEEADKNRSSGIYWWDKNLNREIDEYEIYPYIPLEPYEKNQLYIFDYSEKGLFETYWWDKNSDNEQQEDEIFVDINGDGIPDCNFLEYCRAIEAEKRAANIV